MGKHRHIIDSAKRISARFKSLRYHAKKWTKIPSNIDTLIEDLNDAILLFDSIEESRILTTEEGAFRKKCKDHLCACLNSQKTYWKQRGKIKWVKLGDENSNSSTHWLPSSKGKIKLHV